MNRERLKEGLKENRLLLAGSIVIFLAGILVWTIFPMENQDFQSAAGQISRNFRSGEVVIMHPPGNTWYLDAFNRFPVVAPRKLGREDLAGFAGVWIVTSNQPRAEKLFKSALKRFPRHASVKFGDLTVLHHWGSGSKKKKK